MLMLVKNCSQNQVSAGMNLLPCNRTTKTKFGWIIQPLTSILVMPNWFDSFKSKGMVTSPSQNEWINSLHNSLNNHTPDEAHEEIKTHIQPSSWRNKIHWTRKKKKKKLKSKTKKRPRNELHQASNQPHFFESKTKSIKDNKGKGKWRFNQAQPRWHF